MEKNIIDYFSMKLLQNPKREMQRDRSIKEIYNQPERLNPEDANDDYECPLPNRSYKIKVRVCESPTCGNK